MPRTCGLLTILVCLWLVGYPLDGGVAAARLHDSHKAAAFQTIPEARFRDLLNRYLHDRLGGDVSDVIVSRLRIAGNRPVPAGRLDFRLFQKDRKELWGYVRLVAVIRVNGKVENEVKLHAWVDVFRPVVCTCRNIRKGEIIREEDIYLEKKNVSRLGTGALMDKRKVVGLLARHNIRAETCLKEWMLERPSVVRRGDRVIILAQSGGLTVTVPGMVLENGYLGEIVKVRNSMSKKVIYARVVNNDTVRVEF